MIKYFSILKMSLNESFKYIPSLLFRFVGYFITMFALTSVWKFVYSDSTQIINGYTYAQMIWYLLLAETLGYASSRGVQDEITNDIKSGSIAYKVNKPYSYVGYNFMRYMGDSILRFVMYLIISILIGLLFVGKIDLNLNLLSILCVLLVTIFAISLSGLIKILISLSSFWVEDSTPFHWVYSKLLLIFGIFFPIEMFPKLMQPIIKASPVFVVLYGPVKLILSFTYSFFLKVLLVQFIYLIIILLLTTLIYKKGVKKLNVNGG